MSPQWDTGMLSHCLCQAVKSNAKLRPNRSNVACYTHHIWQVTITYVWSANVLLHLVHWSSIRVFWVCVMISFWKSVFFSFKRWNTCVSLHVLTRQRVSDLTERGRAMTWAHSLLPKTKTLATTHIMHATGGKRNDFTSWLLVLFNGLKTCFCGGQMTL